jgi:hypothetical protein
MFTLSSAHFSFDSSFLTGYGEVSISTIKRSALGILNIRCLLTNLSGARE